MGESSENLRAVGPFELLAIEQERVAGLRRSTEDPISTSTFDGDDAA